MSDKSNQQSPEHSGDPAGQGQRKADPNSRPLAADEQRLADEYTEDGLDEIPPFLVNNPNRNYDKPDLDKPAYS